MVKQPRPDDLPLELEYLRKPALKLVGRDRQIVGCGQVDFTALEKAIEAQLQGLTRAQANARRAEHRRLLGHWLARHEDDNGPLVTGLQFVVLLWDSRDETFESEDDFDES